MIAKVERLHDCMYRVRYAYRLAAPLAQDFLDNYQDDHAFVVQVYDATHLLPQSKPVFTVSHAQEYFLIKGSLGGDYVTVTYLKEADDAWRELVEAHLNAA